MRFHFTGGMIREAFSFTVGMRDAGDATKVIDYIMRAVAAIVFHIGDATKIIRRVRGDLGIRGPNAYGDCMRFAIDRLTAFSPESPVTTR